MNSFKVVAEKLEGEMAVIAVPLTGLNTPRPKPADRVLRYDFVREAGLWKIDDIRGASDREPWSIRDMLARSLKNQLSSPGPAGLLPNRRADLVFRFEHDRFRITLYPLLPMPGHVLIAQVPVLPQLQGCQQHHEPAKT